jgi:hypothetical protein
MIVYPTTMGTAVYARNEISKTMKMEADWLSGTFVSYHITA